ncbi:MAG: apolipoprotein N-acyltransferase [Deltaproteobacteria bacterium]|nr:apolipoprotein N-acyltransferase [Deltaproteobacteria bacterium]
MPGFSISNRALDRARGRTHDLISYFLSLLSGILLSLAFPRPSLWPLIFVALLPLLFACYGKGLKFAFGLGYLTGLIHAVTLLYWLLKVLTFYGGLHILLAIPTFYLLIGYMALYPAFFALGLSLSEKHLKLVPGSLTWILVGAALYTGLEYFKGIFLSGFPWEPVGAALVANLSLVQFSDIVGTSGLTFIAVMVNLSFFALGLRYQEGKLKALLVPGALVMIALCGLWLYGHFRLAQVEAMMARSQKHEVTVVQGNIDQVHKWDPEYRGSIMNTYRDLTLEAARKHPWLIIWPEAATPFFFLNEQEETAWLKDLVKKINKPLFFGSPAYEYQKNGPRYYNRAYLVNQRGEVAGHYDKVHLVPYGEYVPFKRFFPFLGKITQAVGDYSGGTHDKLIPYKGTRIGVLICYESLFSSLARARVVKGANYLVNPTNDAWYGHTSAPYQLLSQSRLRAVENRRTVIRAANTGISAIIWPTGEVIVKLGFSERGVITGLIPYMDSKTIYTYIGEIIPQLCLIVVFIVYVLGFIRRRRCLQI